SRFTADKLTGAHASRLQRLATGTLRSSRDFLLEVSCAGFALQNLRFTRCILKIQTGGSRGPRKLFIAYRKADALAFDFGRNKLGLWIFGAALGNLHNRVMATSGRNDHDSHSFKIARILTDGKILVDSRYGNDWLAKVFSNGETQSHDCDQAKQSN